MTVDGGGYILAASHTIPPETPEGNIFAMYEAAGISREEIFDRAADLRRTARSAERDGGSTAPPATPQGRGKP
jgi:hypothetical protein